MGLYINDLEENNESNLFSVDDIGFILLCK